MTQAATQQQQTQKPIKYSARLMDPSHVALIDVPDFCPARMGIDQQIRMLEACATLVEELTLREGETDGQGENEGRSYGINLEEALKCLKAEKRRGATGMDWEFGKDKLTLGRYKIRLVEGSASSSPLPKIPHTYIAHITGAVIVEYMEAAKVMGDYMTVTAEADALKFHARGETGEYNDSIAMPSYSTPRKKDAAPELIATGEIKLPTKEEKARKLAEIKQKLADAEASHRRAKKAEDEAKSKWLETCRANQKRNGCECEEPNLCYHAGAPPEYLDRAERAEIGARADVDWARNELRDAKGTKDTPIEATYSIEYVGPLKGILQKYKNELIEVKIGRNKPLQMHLPDIGVFYYLAPRVDS